MENKPSFSGRKNTIFLKISKFKIEEITTIFQSEILVLLKIGIFYKLFKQLNLAFFEFSQWVRVEEFLQRSCDFFFSIKIHKTDCFGSSWPSVSAKVENKLARF